MTLMTLPAPLIELNNFCYKFQYSIQIFKYIIEYLSDFYNVTLFYINCMNFVNGFGAVCHEKSNLTIYLLWNFQF